MSEIKLSRYPLFSSLDEAQLQRVGASVRQRRLSRGEALFDQGSEAHHFFILQSGAIKLFLLSREGDEKVVEVVQPGQLFAEAVMFMDGGSYPVSAEALADASVLAIDNAVFLNILEDSPKLALKLLAEMSRRMHGLLKEIDELTLHNARYRFVAYLLNLVGEQQGAGVHLRAPKQVIASRLSIKPETLSRLLARLKAAQLIEVHADDVTLLDIEGLRAILEN